MSKINNKTEQIIETIIEKYKEGLSSDIYLEVYSSYVQSIKIKNGNVIEKALEETIKEIDDNCFIQSSYPVKQHSGKKGKIDCYYVGDCQDNIKNLPENLFGEKYDDWHNSIPKKDKRRVIIECKDHDNHDNKKIDGEISDLKSKREALGEDCELVIWFVEKNTIKHKKKCKEKGIIPLYGDELFKFLGYEKKIFDIFKEKLDKISIKINDNDSNLDYVVDSEEIYDDFYKENKENCDSFIKLPDDIIKKFSPNGVFLNKIKELKSKCEYETFN